MLRRRVMRAFDRSFHGKACGFETLSDAPAFRSRNHMDAAWWHKPCSETNSSTCFQATMILWASDWKEFKS